MHCFLRVLGLFVCYRVIELLACFLCCFSYIESFFFFFFYSFFLLFSLDILHLLAYIFKLSSIDGDRDRDRQQEDPGLDESKSVNIDICTMKL